MIPPGSIRGPVAARGHTPRSLLVCLGNEVPAARHCLQATPQLAESIGSLELKPGLYGRHEGAVDLTALSQIIGLCPNLSSLQIWGPLDLEGFATQLLQRHAGGLLKMREIEFSDSSTLPPHLLLQLLQAMPNLQRCGMLPRASSDESVDVESLASFIIMGPIRTQRLEVHPRNAEYLLPLFLSRRWIARRVLLAPDPSFLRTLRDYGGPHSDTVDAVDITLISWTNESPAPLTSWMTRTCAALRRLSLVAYDAYMLELLVPLLTAGVFRLRELELIFRIDEPYAGRQAVIDVAALLLSWLPALATLRALRIVLGGEIHSQGPHGHHLHDVRLLCHTRRIVYSLRGSHSGYATPAPQSQPPGQA